MSRPQGLVSKIIRFSVVDGPGNRLVIFLQGCNFNCINCHNPHTIGICNGCGLCVAECPGKALRFANEINGGIDRDREENRRTGLNTAQSIGRAILYDEAKCVHCDHCMEICPADSNPRVRWMHVEEVLFDVRRVQPFISGITVSGGEATQQWEFIEELFTAMKSDSQLKDLTTLIDSNGSASLDIWERLLPVTDGVMVDLKALDPEIHRQLTGVQNDTILTSIAYLFRQKKLYEVRLLLIPEFNAEREQIQATANYLSRISPGVRLRLIPFRKHGVRHVADRLQEPLPEKMDEAQKIFQDAGFHEIIVT